MTSRQVTAMFRTLAAVNTGRGPPPTPGTLHRIRATLRVALNAAIREGLRSDNPARHVELPGPRRPHAQVWTNQRINAWREQGQRPIVAVWMAEYRIWLVVDRGLAAPTVLRYENLARGFLYQLPAAEGGRLVVNLTAADVVGFLLQEGTRVSVGAVKGRVAELRSLLRFLHVKGFTPTALATAVPPAAGWHDTGIPVGLATAAVQRLLDGCDRASSTGIRNFAILMLVARLGLRSAEVARLELGEPPR